MFRLIIVLGVTCAGLSLSGCVTPPEDKPVGPQSNSSQMPWNTPRPGEGSAQFGGMLDRR